MSIIEFKKTSKHFGDLKVLDNSAILNNDGLRFELQQNAIIQDR